MSYTSHCKFNPLSRELAENGVDFERYVSLEQCSYHTLQSVNQAKKSESYHSKAFLDLLHVNARSLTRNIDAILSLLNGLENKVTCILVSETWLNDSKAAPAIAEYTFVGTNREGRTGGGTGLYVLTEIPYRLRNDLCMSG